jgi:methylmalonyl-CoA mutase
VLLSTTLVLLLCALLLCAVADAEAVPVRQIDNSAVLTAQLARLSSVKASRDDAAVAAALQAIEAAAHGSERQPNLMELAVQVRPVNGKVSDATAQAPFMYL